MKTITVLGSTGSIGRQTLEVCAKFKQEIRPAALTAGGNWQLLAEQCRLWRPKLAAIYDENAYAPLKAAVADLPVTVAAGAAGVEEAAAFAESDTVVAAISGIAGLAPTLAAIEAGKTIALANKEALVTAGPLVLAAAKRRGVAILPVDSEHSALWQCLKGEDPAAVSQLVITASGGPFLHYSESQLAQVTPEMALRHPKWHMGAKITVDSATLVNKGLEIIEAHYLFQVDYARIQPVIHPQSIVHSLVVFADGSVKAQMAAADMRLPIQYALLYPQRPAGLTAPLDISRLGELHFSPVDHDRFPALGLAIEAGQAGGGAPVVFNGANEALVRRFLQGQIAFPEISRGLAGVLQRYPGGSAGTLEEIRHWHDWAQRQV